MEVPKSIIKSVGIDIGSSTSSLMFSELTLAQPSNKPASKLEVIERNVTYRSKILLTPYTDRFKTVDSGALKRFIDAEYSKARVNANQIDTGAVIITGEAATKANSSSIIQLFSQETGKFVCAVAGPNLEAVLAAHGSGAVARSSAPHKHEDSEHIHPRMIMNVDVGGGTTKVALAYGGQILYTASINVGARLVSFDENGKIDRLEESGKRVAKECGFGDLDYGVILSLPQAQAMSSKLADALFSLIMPGRKLDPLGKSLIITGENKYPYDSIDALIFSGGVSEFIYERDTNDYGDLGRLLAEEIRKRAFSPDFPIPIELPDEFLRATVIGASQYSMQLSGNTIYISNEDILPIHNIPVYNVELGEKEYATPDSVRLTIGRVLQMFDIGGNQTGAMFAIAIQSKILGYEGLKSLAIGLKGCADDLFDTTDTPLILITKQNLGASLGRILVHDIGIRREVISIDEIDLSGLDYIDIGSKVHGTDTVPVVVKSLMFESFAKGGQHSHRTHEPHSH